jgi:hypothetical protein
LPNNPAGDQRLRVASMIKQKIPIESNVTLLDLTIPYFPSLSCNLSVLHVIFIDMETQDFQQ